MILTLQMCLLFTGDNVYESDLGRRLVEGVKGNYKYL